MTNMNTSNNVKKSAAHRNGMTERSIARHKEFWPEVPDEALWRYQTAKGYVHLPRTMPILMAIIDTLTKGAPAGKTYLVLWCRCPGYAAINIAAPNDFAAESGLSGQRMLDGWKKRMKSLEELGFIKALKGASGDFHDVLLLNPHEVVRKIETVPESLRRQLFARGQEIGAKDIGNSVERAANLVVRRQAESSEIQVDCESSA